MKTSAGLLIYRLHEGRREVFLAHPGGPYWRNRDAHAWSIPKGEMDPGDEDPLTVARREFREETGQAPPDGPATPLEPVRQSGKRILAFAVAGEPDAERIESNRFAMEWPPRSGRQAHFPEVDRAAWFDIAEARAKIHRGQRALLDQLEALLDGS